MSIGPVKHRGNANRRLGLLPVVGAVVVKGNITLELVKTNFSVQYKSQRPKSPLKLMYPVSFLVYTSAGA